MKIDLSKYSIDELIFLKKCLSNKIIKEGITDIKEIEKLNSLSRYITKRQKEGK